MVVAVALTEMSAKIRAGDPIDEPADLGGPHWAGHVPVRTTWEAPVAVGRPHRGDRCPRRHRRAGGSAGVTRRNRVDPWGDLHAVSTRGLFTGNRGLPRRRRRRDRAPPPQHDAVDHVRTSFRGWRHPLDEPHVWTPLFFLDDAVALAAGHRPCATCRRDDYRAYRDAVAAADGGPPPLAVEMDRRLTAERLRRGRGFDRHVDRRLWAADVDDLPDGTVIVDDGEAAIVVGDTAAARSRSPAGRRPEPGRRPVGSTC